MHYRIIQLTYSQMRAFALGFPKMYPFIKGSRSIEVSWGRRSTSVHSQEHSTDDLLSPLDVGSSIHNSLNTTSRSKTSSADIGGGRYAILE
jgi:hypothetical protein